MDAPELTTFGSLVRFALGLEAATAAFYEAAANLLGTGSPAEFAARMSAEHDARRRLLERTRQQRLNEMVLEPITGLDGSRYTFDASLHGREDVRSRAVALEEIAERLYRESSAVAQSLLVEASRTFRKLGEENARNLARIQDNLPA